MFGQTVAEGRVLAITRVLLPPSVEVEDRGGNFAVVVFDEIGPRIGRPLVVEVQGQHINGLPALGARLVDDFGWRKHSHRFEIGNSQRYRGVSGLCGV